MIFSVEELYFMYGQYDAFVALQFHERTKSYEVFGGNGVMGSFKYTLQEKRSLEQFRAKEAGAIPSTKGNFKFVSSYKHSLTEEIQI